MICVLFNFQMSSQWFGLQWSNESLFEERVEEIRCEYNRYYLWNYTYDLVHLNANRLKCLRNASWRAMDIIILSLSWTQRWCDAKRVSMYLPVLQHNFICHVKLDIYIYNMYMLLIWHSYFPKLTGKIEEEKYIYHDPNYKHCWIICWRNCTTLCLIILQNVL